MDNPKVIIGKIHVDGAGPGEVEFEFEVNNWDKLTDDQKHKAFVEALWESGVVDAWYEDPEEEDEEEEEEFEEDQDYDEE